MSAESPDDARRPRPLPSLGHQLRRMTGCDPSESHRAATPLELLFDLAFVVAFGLAADQLAHEVAFGHTAAGVIGFCFAIFGTCWAWINFSWFASAYDTDDWFYRLTTMVQMIGVVVFALGLPAMFHSLELGHGIDNVVMVVGYVIMRVALLTQWLRAARQDPARRDTAMAYVTWVSIAQVGWIVLALLHTTAGFFFLFGGVLFLVEFTGPVVAERKSAGTPWHPHHIAERYALLAIIALGEGVLGTVAAVSAVVDEQEWSVEAVLIVVAGIGLTFGLWWCYFMIPSGPILEHHRERSFPWGYGHVFIYGSIAATGAGLHLAALVIEGDPRLTVGVVAAVVATAVPVAVFLVALFGLYTYLAGEFDRFHLGLFSGSMLVLAAAVGLAVAGGSLGACLILITLAPAVVVVGYELVGHRHQAAMLQRNLGRSLEELDEEDVTPVPNG